MKPPLLALWNRLFRRRRKVGGTPRERISKEVDVTTVTEQPASAIEQAHQQLKNAERQWNQAKDTLASLNVQVFNGTCDGLAHDVRRRKTDFEQALDLAGREFQEAQKSYSLEREREAANGSHS